MAPATARKPRLFVPQDREPRAEITIAAPYAFSGTTLEWNGFTVLPCARDSAGNDTIVSNHEYLQGRLDDHPRRYLRR